MIWWYPASPLSDVTRQILSLGVFFWLSFWGIITDLPEHILCSRWFQHIFSGLLLRLSTSKLREHYSDKELTSSFHNKKGCELIRTHASSKFTKPANLMMAVPYLFRDTLEVNCFCLHFSEISITIIFKNKLRVARRILKIVFISIF